MSLRWQLSSSALLAGVVLALPWIGTPGMFLLLAFIFSLPLRLALAFIFPVWVFLEIPGPPLPWIQTIVAPASLLVAAELAYGRVGTMRGLAHISTSILLGIRWIIEPLPLIIGFFVVIVLHRLELDAFLRVLSRRELQSQMPLQPISKENQQ